MNQFLKLKTPDNVTQGTPAVAESEKPAIDVEKPRPTAWQYFFGVIISGVCVILLLVCVFALNYLRGIIFDSSTEGPAPDGYNMLMEGLDVFFTMLNSLVIAKLMLYAKSNCVYYLYENPLITRGYPDYETDKSQINNPSAQKRLKCYERDFYLFFIFSFLLSLAYRLLKSTMLTS